MSTLTRKQLPLMRKHSDAYWLERSQILDDPRVKNAPLFEKQAIINQIRKERGL